MVPLKRIINAHGAKLNFTIPKTRATYTTTTTSIITITPTTPITPKHIGIIVEMDIPVKLAFSNTPESIQITIMSNLPERFLQLRVGDEVDLEGTSIKFGIITFVENRGIITIQVETEWAALHRLEVGMQMDLTGWD